MQTARLDQAFQVNFHDEWKFVLISFLLLLKFEIVQQFIAEIAVETTRKIKQNLLTFQSSLSGKFTEISLADKIKSVRVSLTQIRLKVLRHSIDKPPTVVISITQKLGFLVNKRVSITRSPIACSSHFAEQVSKSLQQPQSFYPPLRLPWQRHFDRGFSLRASPLPDLSTLSPLSWELPLLTNL